MPSHPKTLALLFALGMILGPGNAAAIAISTSEVTVDWSTFGISGGTAGTDFLLPPNVPSGGRASGAFADATTDANPTNPRVGPTFVFTQTDWADVTPTVNSITNAEGRAGITDNALSARGSATADGVATLNANGLGFVFRNTDFDVPGTASDAPLTLTFSFDYSFEQALTRDATDESASAFTQISIVLFERNLAPGGGIIATEFAREFDPFSNSLSGPLLGDTFMGSDTVSITHGFERGRQYAVEGQLVTSSVASVPERIVEVPEPATLPLFGVGLLVLGFMAFRRRGAA